MTSFRLVAGIAAGIALAAFALGSAHLGALSEPPAPAPAVAPPLPALAPPRAPGPAKATAPSAPSSRASGAGLPPSARGAAARPHVPAGVLARAASLRKQEREATCPAPAPAAPGDGGVESIEIDWNAPPPAEP